MNTDQPNTTCGTFDSINDVNDLASKSVTQDLAGYYSLSQCLRGSQCLREQDGEKVKTARWEKLGRRWPLLNPYLGTNHVILIPKAPLKSLPWHELPHPYPESQLKQRCHF
jgi:hypothetical protein